MLATLKPLHEMMDNGPETPSQKKMAYVVMALYSYGPI